MTRATFDLRHPAGPCYAIFRAERFDGLSFGHTADEAIDLWLGTMEPAERRWKTGPWSAVLEPEARARGMIGAQL